MGNEKVNVLPVLWVNTHTRTYTHTHGAPQLMRDGGCENTRGVVPVRGLVRTGPLEEVACTRELRMGKTHRAKG